MRNAVEISHQLLWVGGVLFVPDMLRGGTRPLWIDFRLLPCSLKRAENAAPSAWWTRHTRGSGIPKTPSCFSSLSPTARLPRSTRRQRSAASGPSLPPPQPRRNALQRARATLRLRNWRRLALLRWLPGAWLSAAGTAHNKERLFSLEGDGTLLRGASQNNLRVEVSSIFIRGRSP